MEPRRLVGAKELGGDARFALDGNLRSDEFSREDVRQFTGCS
jgi:hypothetical protein